MKITPSVPLLIHGDSEYELSKFPANFFSAHISDFPYQIEFMGCKWDKKKDFRPIFKEMFRTLKPAGKVIAFTGGENYHKFANELEQCGFEIFPMAGWINAKGVPHGKNFVKAIISDEHPETFAWKIIQTAREDTTYSFCFEKDKVKESVIITIPPEMLKYDDRKLQSKLKFLPEVSKYCGYSLVSYVPPVSAGFNYTAVFRNTAGDNLVVNGEWTNTMARLDGYHSELKPALEPILVAAKPITGSLTENIIKYGTGGLFIDACRIPFQGMENVDMRQIIKEINAQMVSGNLDDSLIETFVGKLRAEQIHALRDDIKKQVVGFNAKTNEERTFIDGQNDSRHRNGGNVQANALDRIVKKLDSIDINAVSKELHDSTVRFDPKKGKGAFWGAGTVNVSADFKNSTVSKHRTCSPFGGAYDGAWDRDTQLTSTDDSLQRLLGRFPSNIFVDQPDVLDADTKYFLCPKATTKEKDMGLDGPNPHPTVKPLRLMTHLIKLYCGTKDAAGNPPIICDPFMGSGSTIMAAKIEGVCAVGIELMKDHYDVAVKRVNSVKVERKLW
jgi:DNA modification methylase